MRIQIGDVILQIALVESSVADEVCFDLLYKFACDPSGPADVLIEPSNVRAWKAWNGCEPSGKLCDLIGTRLEVVKKMKIAFVSDDGVTISQHFGRAQQYVVVTVENGKMEKREVRDKLGHMHSEREHGHEEDGEHHHGPEADHRHGLMMEPIADCEVLIAGGMGGGAMQSLLSRNIRPVMTDIKSIDDAVKAFIDGRLENRSERIHH